METVVVVAEKAVAVKEVVRAAPAVGSEVTAALVAAAVLLAGMVEVVVKEVAVVATAVAVAVALVATAADYCPSLAAALPGATGTFGAPPLSVAGCSRGGTRATAQTAARRGLTTGCGA